MGINYEAARSQAFGGHFNPLPTDEKIAADLMNGRLILRPHAAWTLPEQVFWSEDPFTQRNWVAQFHMLRWLDPVRRVALAGDSRAREYWLRTVRSWVDANKPGNGRSPYAWADMVDGIRALELAFGLPLAGPAEEQWLVDSLEEHALWLSDERNLGHSNHALHQHQGLMVCGLVLEQDQWVKLATARMIDLFNESYDDQGVNAEGSIGYHRHNYVWWEAAFRRLDVAGIERPDDAAKLNLALEELAYATKPNLQFERIGDIDSGGPKGLSSPEIDFILSRGAEGTPPSENSKVYDAGYVFGRSGWGEYEKDFDDELFFSLSFGSASRVHGHQDGGSLTLHSSGEPWLVDVGKYAYVNDDMRRYCVSRLAHNVVHVEGRRYNPKSIVRLVRHELSSEVDDFEFIDSGYDGVELNRRVIYSRGGDFVVVIDTVRSESAVTVHQRWHLDPETQVTRTPLGYSLSRGAKSASIDWRGKAPELEAIRGAVKPLDGWIATEWMQKEPTTVISARRHGDRFRLVTVIGATPHPSGTDFTSLEIDRPSSYINVRSGKQNYVVEVAPRHAKVYPGVYTPKSSGQTRRPPLVEAHELVQELLQGVENRAPNLSGSYVPEDWGRLREWIRQSPNQDEARLMALDVLLNEEISEKASRLFAQSRKSAILDLAGTNLTFGRITASSLGIMREPLTAWKSENLISSTYRLPVLDGSRSDDLIANDAQTLVYVADVDGLSLPFAVHRGSTDVLSVRFHGAVNRTKSSLPLFPGLTSEKKRGTTSVIFQDPTLDLDSDLRLAWYLGRPGVNLHAYMADCVRNIQARTGIEKVILTGSSGGGFAALQVAGYLEDAVVLVLNPQTSVLEYHSAAVQRALKVSSDGRDLPMKRLSVIEHYKDLNRIPRIIYVQNSQDAHHVKKHMKPFQEMVDRRSDRASEAIEYVHVDWGHGHVAANAEKYEEFWQMAVAKAHE